MNQPNQTVKLYYEGKNNWDNQFEVKDDLKKVLYTIKFTRVKAELIEAGNEEPLLHIVLRNQLTVPQDRLHVYIREKSDLRQFCFYLDDPYRLEIVESSNFVEVSRYACHKVSGTWGITLKGEDDKFIGSLKHGVSETKFGTLDFPEPFDEFKTKVLVFAFTLLIHSIKAYELSLTKATKPGKVPRANAFFNFLAGDSAMFASK